MFLVHHENGSNTLYGSFIGNAAELEVSPVIWSNRINKIKLSSFHLTHLDEQTIFWNIYETIHENIESKLMIGLRTLIIMSTFKNKFSIEIMSIKMAQLFDRKIWCDDQSKLLFDELNEDIYIDQCRTHNQHEADFFLINDKMFKKDVSISNFNFFFFVPFPFLYIVFHSLL